MIDPHKDLLRDPPAPCSHGNGNNCECQLPWYEGLFVLPIKFADGKTRHIVARMKQAHDGGMREFIDPVSGETVGSCGSHFPVSTLTQALDELSSFA